MEEGLAAIKPKSLLLFLLFSLSFFPFKRPFPIDFQKKPRSQRSEAQRKRDEKP